MKYAIFHRLPLILAAVLLMTGCNTAYKMTYLQDMSYNMAYPAKPAPELIVHKGDMLAIQVYSSSPELVAPFRLSGTASADNGKGVDVYTVDSAGEIVFPVIGRVKVEGKTLRSVQDQIADLISRGGYIKSPTVWARIANFTVTVVGNAGNTVIPVEDSSINILQVIARSGGVKGGGNNIKEVTVIRTEGDVRTAHKVNLRSKGLFDSPVFYLQQGDIVYVKPQGAQLSSSGQTALSFATVALSLGTIITNFILWSNR